MSQPRKKMKATPEDIRNVPLLDLKAQYATIREEVQGAINEVCESQYFVLGPKVAELEQSVAAYSGCKYGIGVSSGTDALLIALMALDIGPGDAVITTPYTFFATGGTITRVGARPVFCDIDPETYNLDPKALADVIHRECKTLDGKLVHEASGAVVRAVMPVHLYGQMADMAAIMEITREYALAVVEDAAQAIGSETPDRRRAGSIGDIGCFSFFPSKNLGAFGDGGMCTTNNEALAEKLKVLRVHGGKPKYHHAIIGGNFRLDALQAAVLSVKLKYLDSWSRGRQANADYYDEAFASSGAASMVKTPHRIADGRHIFNQYVIGVPRRDELRAYLKDNGIATEIYYPVPLHQQQCFADLGYSDGSCPHSESAAESTLALPVYPELTKEHLDYVVGQIANFYR